jgi:alpha-amylase/alpha-mannosidase (GH57 family)
MARYICIHGHFYQPPRENPWLEDIELQDSAYPYHDWNEKITAECYARNSVSRILDGEGRIINMPNNYAKMSYNFGPTLLAWLAVRAPDVYEAVIAADRQSQEVFSGHGSALAQVYNHMIMPLANRRDKYTQVYWGLRDFEHRFGRSPEGMWLAETAVDLETLDIMAELGIDFTILAPNQAHQVRPLDQQTWYDVSGSRIDPTTAYQINLPSGRHINLFFYDGPISQAVAFGDVLVSGENLAHRLVGAFSDDRDWPQLVHIATDGETFGHHHSHGEMALSYALDLIEREELASLANYGEFLERHPPAFEVSIFEGSSWSCPHGIERWRSNCGCHSGMHPGWNQAWREPLRVALDWLRDTLAPLYEHRASRFLKDPWESRNEYIRVILDRSPAALENYLIQQATRELNHTEKSNLLKLLEMQRYTMLMYTSCGWFFDELSGIETIQVMQYAGRALQLAQDVFGNGIEEPFLERLAQAKSNIPEHQNGRHIYQKFVKPTMVDLLKVGAHYAISSLFEDYQTHDKIYCYAVTREDYRVSEVGKAKLAIGLIQVSSDITHNAATISFGVLHFGDQNLVGGVREFQGEEPYGSMAWEVTEAFDLADLPETIRRIDKHFGASTYSLRSLFRDEQRKVLDQILEITLDEIMSSFGRIYSNYVPLMRFLKDLSIPLPKPFQTTAETVLNWNLRQAFLAPELEPESIPHLLDEVKVLRIPLDNAGLEYALRQGLENLAAKCQREPENPHALVQLDAAVGLIKELPFAVNLWKVQNIYYDMLQNVYHQWRREAKQDRREAKLCVKHFKNLGKKLSVRVS